MSAPEERHVHASMARMLRTALAAALAPNADAESMPTARSAAQIVGLTGLAAGLDVLGARRGTLRAPQLAALAARIGGLLNAELLSDFRDADPELIELAAGAELEASAAPGDGGATGSAGVTETPMEDFEPEELEGDEPGEIATLTAAEALDGLPIEGGTGGEALRRTRLTVHVSSALRAALEWLTRDTGRPRPFRVRAEDSLLEVTCDSVHPGGLLPAHEVLAAADGSLAPVGDTTVRSAAGAWTVRVPAWSPRPAYLMLEQGPLRLAVPWYSVLRLSMVPAIEFEIRGAHLATPVLKPLAPLAEGVGERPVVAVAHGLKRGLLVADRLVWRLTADDCVPDEPAPVASLERAVRSEDGDVFWVAEPRVLLAELPMPRLPEARPTPPARPAPPVVVEPEPVAVEPEPVAVEPEPIAVEPEPVAELPPVKATAPEVPVPAAPEPEPIVLAAEDLEPLFLEGADVEPLGTPMRMDEPAPRAAPAEPAGPKALPSWLERIAVPARDAAPPRPEGTPAGRPVLIAEDSIAAGHFLARLFEQAGFSPQLVEKFADLNAALALEPWALACLDIELRDATDPEWFGNAAATLAGSGIPIVALVRDDLDAEVARRAGVRRWLRKPFDREELAHLLRTIGLVAKESV